MEIHPKDVCLVALCLKIHQHFALVISLCGANSVSHTLQYIVYYINAATLSPTYATNKVVLAQFHLHTGITKTLTV